MRASPWILVTALLAIPAVTGRASERPAMPGTFAPPLFGSETVERARARGPMPAAARDPWRAFLAAHPGPWRAEWDARAGTPRQIWGASFPLVPENATAGAVEAAVRRLFSRELAALVRVPDARLRTAVLVRSGDTWFVRLDRITADGTPVAGAFAEARITRGRLVLLRLETHPDAERVTSPRAFDAARATGLAEDALRAFRRIDRSDATPVLAPSASGTGWAYRPAWEVVTRATSGEIWRTRVDAVYGELLARDSLTPSFSGRVTGMVEPRTVGEALVEQAMPHVLVETTGTSMAVASTDGVWTFADPAPLSLELRIRGPFVAVQHAVATEAFTPFVALDGASDFTWTTADATQAEISAYRHVSTVRAWAYSLVPGLPWLQESVTAQVGLPDQCNALWDGTMLLYGEGPDCNDTARIADVVYHEYGHGFHDHVQITGVVDPTVGEGVGDYVSATITNSPRIGLGLLKGGPGDGALRDVGEDRVYPDDLVGETHTDGLIFAGAMWDVRNALMTQLGAVPGRRAADLLFAEIVEAGPRLDQVFVEALLADDDDANLANGTPNLCLLEMELGRHGLAGASGLFSLDHTEVVGPVASNAPISITASRPPAAAICGANEITAVTLHWQIGEDAFSQQMTLAGDTLSAEIPEVTGFVRYWFESTLESGNGTVLTPPRAPMNAFGFHAGPLEVIWLDDFESAGEWTSGGEGDDWQLGPPQGLGGDPAAAYSGANVIGNRLDGDGEYAPGADSWIESPPVDCRRCRGALLQFRRWGKVQQSISDRATVGIGTLPVWQNEPGLVTFDEATVDDPFWSFQEYDVSELADGGANIRIRFSLESDNFLEFGGWTIDDVAIVMPAGGDAGDDGGRGCGCSLAPAARPPLASIAMVALLAAAWLGAFYRERRETRRAAPSANVAGSGRRLTTRCPGCSKSKK